MNRRRQGILPFVYKNSKGEDVTARAGLPLVVETFRALGLDWGCKQILTRCNGKFICHLLPLICMTWICALTLCFRCSFIVLGVLMLFQEFFRQPVLFTVIDSQRSPQHLGSCKIIYR